MACSWRGSSRLTWARCRCGNVPVLVKSPALRGMPRPESESFSPLAIGLSMTIDYGQRLLTIGSKLPPFEADHRLPDAYSPLAGRWCGRAQRQPPGLLRCRPHRRRSHLDQLGHRAAAAAVAISADSAACMGHVRWDRDAFLAPRRRSRVRPHRIPQSSSRRSEPSRAEPAARIPAGRDRRAQVPCSLPRRHRSGHRASCGCRSNRTIC